ncbi:MAG: hypothetical protein JSR19_02900 [Proteobacteria bacterium]|nr:hypothetical protein [Pseudomonadota bacterium]HQR03851.1 hypothetical protein [Rhodocyclaceae bacterium]
MKLLLALTCVIAALSAGGLRAQEDPERQAQLNEIQRLQEQASTERTAAEQEYRTKQAGCYQKILMTACLDEARGQLKSRQMDARELDRKARHLDQAMRQRDHAAKETQREADAPRKEAEAAAQAEKARQKREEAEARLAQKAQEAARHP